MNFLETFNMLNKLYEAEKQINRAISTKENIDYARMDSAIKANFGTTTPSAGASYISSDGTFINNFGEEHQYLQKWVIDRGFIVLPTELVNNEKSLAYDNFFQEISGNVEGYLFINKPLNYIKCNTLDGHCYAILPDTLPSTKQLNSLELWLDKLINSKQNSTIEFSSASKPSKVLHSYYLSDYDAQTLIKRIKRYYASGKFYENLI